MNSSHYFELSLQNFVPVLAPVCAFLPSLLFALNPPLASATLWPIFGDEPPSVGFVHQWHRSILRIYPPGLSNLVENH